MNHSEITETDSGRKSFSFCTYSSFSNGFSPDNRKKGTFLSQVLRTLSFRSVPNSDLDAEANPHEQSQAAVQKTRSLDSYFFSRSRKAPSKDPILKVRGDDASKASRWTHVKRVTNRLVVSPLRTIRNSYVDCMTAAAADRRFAGVGMTGFQGPACAGNQRAGFAAEAFQPRPDEQLGDMRLRIQDALRNTQHFHDSFTEWTHIIESEMFHNFTSQSETLHNFTPSLGFNFHHHGLCRWFLACRKGRTNLMKSLLEKKPHQCMSRTRSRHVFWEKLINTGLSQEDQPFSKLERLAAA